MLYVTQPELVRLKIEAYLGFLVTSGSSATVFRLSDNILVNVKPVSLLASATYDRDRSRAIRSISFAAARVPSFLTRRVLAERPAAFKDPAMRAN